MISNPVCRIRIRNTLISPFRGLLFIQYQPNDVLGSAEITIYESNVFGRAEEPEPGVFGSLEPEPLEKKPGAGAAWKKSQEPEPLKN